MDERTNSHQIMSKNSAHPSKHSRLCLEQQLRSKRMCQYQFIRSMQSVLKRQ